MTTQEKQLRPGPHVSGYFGIRNFFFPFTATIHTYPANWTTNPEKNKSALQGGKIYLQRVRWRVDGQIRIFSNPMTQKVCPVSHRTIGSFSKPRAEQWLCTCVLNIGTFLCRPLQNNNVKWPSAMYLGECEPWWLIFGIFFWNWRCRCTLGLASL